MPRRACPEPVEGGASKGCSVSGRFENGLFHDIVFSGEARTEKVLFHPEERVELIRTAGIEMGTIVNEILEDKGAVFRLRFAFTLEREAWRMAAPKSANSPTPWPATI